MSDDASHTIDAHEHGAEPEQLALDDAYRLPWLEGAEDDEPEERLDIRRVILVLTLPILLLVAVLGGVWWATHRGSMHAPIADGAVVAPPPGPYKQPPANPGGIIHQGTGDASFAVSQGQTPAPQLADNSGVDHSAPSPTPAAGPSPAAPPAPTPSTTPSAAAKVAKPSPAAHHAAAKQPTKASAAGDPIAAAVSGAAAGTAPLASQHSDSIDDAAAGGGLAQLGAFASHARAEAAWQTLSQAQAALAGRSHRIIAAEVDNATLYRLLVPTPPGGAHALCSRLQADGVACQVKR